MIGRHLCFSGLVGLLILLFALPATAQSFRVQCPNGTPLHKSLDGKVDSMNAGDPNRPTAANANPQIKCQHISGGDGYATMADGQQIYLFAFGPLSRIADLQKGLPATELASIFNRKFVGPTFPGDDTAPNNAAIKEPALMMNNGVLAGEAPAPMMALDEDDEFFLTLSNVGMIMRPDLFEQHTVHFHGYPNASSYFDGVPDASVAINIAGSFTYYYTAPDAGTYFWHCHITPPEHLQMGMEGQLFVRPRQNKLANGTTGPALAAASVCGTGDGILCNAPTPAAPPTFVHATGNKYAYDDGEGTRRYDVEYHIQMMGFDPNFHYVGMTFNPESFADMKDKYFLLSGRSYPDTVGGSGVDVAGNAVPSPMATEGVDSVTRPSQPQHTLITINKTEIGRA